MMGRPARLPCSIWQRSDPRASSSASTGSSKGGKKERRCRPRKRPIIKGGTSAVDQDDAIFIGKGDVPQHLLFRLSNRHGLIAGATGTGKTVSLQILAEGFAAEGVPVFVADVKGDLSGMSQPGGENPKLDERAATIGMTDYARRAFPVVYWDLFGEQGHPIRTTISEMGPLLLARMMGLNETQEGVLNVAFRAADEQGLLLLDLKDLRSLLNFVGENAQALSLELGRVSTASVGAIQRRLLT